MKALALVILLLATSAAAQEAKVAWESDWKTAFDKAAAQHKAVFVDYSATWCVPCQKMELEVLRLPDVQKELARYIPLKVSFSTESTAVTRAQNVYAYPTFALLDYGERERFRVTGAKDATHFVEWLNAVGKVMPSMLTAALLFDRKDEVGAWMLVGRTYCEAHLLKDAREALGKSRRAAEKANQPKLVQAADIALAVTAAYDGKPQRAVDDLTKIAARAWTTKTPPPPGSISACRRSCSSTTTPRARLSRRCRRSCPRRASSRSRRRWQWRRRRIEHRHPGATWRRVASLLFRRRFPLLSTSRLRPGASGEAHHFICELLLRYVALPSGCLSVALRLDATCAQFECSVALADKCATSAVVGEKHDVALPTLEWLLPDRPQNLLGQFNLASLLREGDHCAWFQISLVASKDTCRVKRKRPVIHEL